MKKKNRRRRIGKVECADSLGRKAIQVDYIDRKAADNRGAVTWAGRNGGGWFPGRFCWIGSGSKLPQPFLSLSFSFDGCRRRMSDSVRDVALTCEAFPSFPWPPAALGVAGSSTADRQPLSKSPSSHQGSPSSSRMEANTGLTRFDTYTNKCTPLTHSKERERERACQDEQNPIPS